MGENYGLSEYLSREARWKLVGACIDGLKEQMKDKSGKIRGNPVQAFAHLVEVSERTVQRWTANGIQSCNVNAERIIELAIELNPKRAQEVLSGDLNKHGTQLDELFSIAQSFNTLPRVGG